MNFTRAMYVVKLNVIFFILAIIVSCGGGGGGKGATPGAEETNANLSSIQISSGSLSFEPDKTTYNVEVEYSVSSLNFTVTTANDKATILIMINGEKLMNTYKAASVNNLTSDNNFNVPLEVGENTIQIIITADDGQTTKTYTLMVTRLAGESNNPDLSGLVISQGNLSPAFDANTTAYSAQVQNSVTSLTVTPTGAGVNTTIKINGTTLVSGTASAAIPLTVGLNTIAMVVTAEDGTTTKTYTLVVSRLAEPSHNANLANLTISQGTLTPGFQPDTVAYTTQVPNSITTITLTPTAAGVNSTIKVNGTAVTSGSPAQAITLVVGSNTIAAVVTAEDGSITKTYTLVVTRLAEPSHNANLAKLTISQGTLSPGFQPNTVGYTAQMPNTITSLTVTPTAAGVNSTIKVNGTAVKSGSPASAITLSVGSKTIPIVVTAEDGSTTKTYTLVVTRLAEPSHNANLANLTVSQGTLTPGFQPDAVVYTAQVPNVITTLTVTPTAAGVNSTIKVNGTAVTSGSPAQEVALVVGGNTISIVVTAQDNTTIKTYTVSVTRLDAPSTNADLASLTLSDGTLSPAFSPDITVYTAHVGSTISSITATPTASGVNTTISVNSSPVVSGIASQSIALSPGINTITVITTAEDGVSQKTYTISVTRDTPPAYTIIELEPFVGGYTFESTTINDSGQIVGSSGSSAGTRRACIYSNGTMTDLGTFGGTYSRALGNNNNGQVVGVANTEINAHAFLYSNGTMTDLNETFGYPNSDACDINNSGQIAGYVATANFTQYLAILYTNGTMTSIGTLGGTHSWAYGINDSGHVVGSADTASTRHAFLYSNGTMTDLGTLGGSTSSASDINDSGQIVGSADTETTSHAFLYSNGTMTDLGTLGGSTSSASEINDSGQIVGSSITTDGMTHGFLYSDGQMIDINSLIDSKFGWTNTWARGINNNGQIVGYGNIHGHTSGFLMTPNPLPAAAGIFGR